jgi:hypothetical protein
LRVRRTNAKYLLNDYRIVPIDKVMFVV